MQGSQDCEGEEEDLVHDREGDAGWGEDRVEGAWRSVRESSFRFASSRSHFRRCFPQLFKKLYACSFEAGSTLTGILSHSSSIRPAAWSHHRRRRFHSSAGTSSDFHPFRILRPHDNSQSLFRDLCRSIHLSSLSFARARSRLVSSPFRTDASSFFFLLSR